MTSWDLRLAGRAFVLAALAFAVAWLLTATTDEGGVAWGVRAGRTLPVAPACAALGTWIALLPARARGEVRALEALGRAPWQSGIAAGLGGAALAVCAAATMAGWPAVDVEGFYPTARHARAYADESGAFVDRRGGWRLEADGSFTSIAPDARATADVQGEPPSLPAQARAAAATATLLAGVALPLLAAAALLAGGYLVRLGFALLACAAGTVLLFHAAAAGRVPALAAAGPAGALLLGTLFGYGASSWRMKRTG